MLYQLEEALFISHFAARTEPCQRIAVARAEVKSETPCFLLGGPPSSKIN